VETVAGFLCAFLAAEARSFRNLASIAAESANLTIVRPR
jgi:hypothetical protein